MTTLEALNHIIKRQIKIYTSVCKVVSVNMDEHICECEPLNGGPNFLEVRLRPTDNDEEKGLWGKPKIGAWCLITLLENHDCMAYMVACDEYEELHVKAEKIILNGEDCSLVKGEELQEQINKLKGTVDALITSINSWTPATGDGGLALKTILTSALVGQTTGNFNNILNETIKHA
jgi:tetrahydromethanopterin S-methyltransferase subunit B